MLITKISVYDFDGTLFRSPEKPEGWSGGWWGNLASLNPPIVPENPGSEWWNENVVRRAKRDVSDEETLSVLLTGRISKFSARLKDLLGRAGLKFDRMHLSSGGDTEAFKLRVIGELLAEFPTATGVNIWEDRANHLRKFADFVESRGKAAFPHLVTSLPQDPEVVPSAAKVAGLYLSRRQ